MLVRLTYVLLRQGGKKNPLSNYNYTNKPRIRTLIVIIIVIINQYTYIARIT